MKIKRKRENMEKIDIIIKNRYHNMSEEKKQELKVYQKQRYREAKESNNNR